MREQLEHDRVIRLLQAKYKRKFEVGINPGRDQTAPVGTGPAAWYPDLVLQSPERGRRLLGVVEVETVESVNNLEAMSQWVAFSRLRGFFHLYVPTASIDVARRLCSDHQVAVAELWAYSVLGGQIRFAVVQRMSPPADSRTGVAGKALSGSLGASDRGTKEKKRVRIPVRASAASPKARPKPERAKREAARNTGTAHARSKKGAAAKSPARARKRK